jgi:hypothetical protein
MNFVTCIAVSAVAFSTAVATAEDSARSSADTRQVVALANTVGVPAAALEDLTGLYRAPSGDTFFVERDGRVLTIELPASLGSEALHLYPAGGLRAFATDGAARVVFENDASGRITGLKFYTASANVVTAERARPQHGVVMVYDVT